MLCYKLSRKIILKINKEKFLDNIKRFERNKALVICCLKDTVVSEEHWPADYLKIIYYGKERPKDLCSVFLLCKDYHVIAMVLSVDEVQANISGNFLPIKPCQIHRICLQHAVSKSVSPIPDIENEMPETLQENLGNLIRGKEDITH